MTAGDEILRENLHGTAVSIEGLAVLLRGPSGSGKSDLALRCIGLVANPLMPARFELVADDRVVVSRIADRIELSCPEPLAGLIEVRGLGIKSVPATAKARLMLLADLVPSGMIERMPRPDDRAVIAGLAVPRVLIAPFEASAPIKLALALQAASAAA